MLQKVSRVVSSKSISDHWKEKVLLRYSWCMVLITIKIAVVIGGIGVFVLVLAGLFDWVLSPPMSTIDVLSSSIGMGVATLASIFYFFVRVRIVSS